MTPDVACLEVPWLERRSRSVVATPFFVSPTGWAPDVLLWEPTLWATGDERCTNQRINPQRKSHRARAGRVRQLLRTDCRRGRPGFRAPARRSRWLRRNPDPDPALRCWPG